MRNHIKDRFVSAEDKESEERRHIYLHYTNATDKNNIDIVFGAACDIILQNNLTRAGMSWFFMIFAFIKKVSKFYKMSIYAK